MLTTATILMSFGTDAANIRYPSSELADSSGNSFAKSFDESSDFADAMQSKVVDGKELKNSADAERFAPAESGRAVAAAAGMKIKRDLSAKDRGPEDSINTKPQVTLASMKVTLLAVGEETKVADDELSQNGANSKDDSIQAIQLEVPEDAKDAVQRPLPVAVDSAAVNAKDGLVDLKADGIASISPDVSNNYAESTIQNAKHLLVLNRNQAMTSAKETKTHDAMVKAKKSAKPEGVKNKTAKDMEVANDISAQTVMVISPTVPLAGASLSVPSKVPDNALISSATAASVASIGLVVAKSSKPDKNSVATEKSDDSSKKEITSASAEDAASRMLEVDASKPTASMARAAIAVVSAAPTHVEPKTVGAEFGGVSASTSAHMIGATRTQTAQLSAHEAATQTDSTSLDGGGNLDAAHKTLLATPTSLEVGVVNGAHGWLKIRAEMAGGGMINASLSTTTSSGQEMLHKELPALTAYLQSERVAVNNVAIQSPITSGIDTRGFEGGMNGGGQEQAPHSGKQRGENEQDTASLTAGRAENGSHHNGTNGIDRDELSPSLPRFGGGSWLNVRV